MYWINSEICTGCGSCMDVCPAGAIFVINDKAHIDETKCNLCGECLDVCANNAIQTTDKAVAREPSVQVERKGIASTLVPKAGASGFSFVLSKLKDFVSSQVQNVSNPAGGKSMGKMNGRRRGYRNRHGAKKKEGVVRTTSNSDIDSRFGRFK